jgi:hypothetical protein
VLARDTAAGCIDKVNEMEILGFIIAFLVEVAMATICLWLAMKLTKEDGPFLGLLAAASIATLVEWLPIPYVGWILSLIVLLALISKFTSAEIWPDAVLIVVVAWSLARFASFALSAAMRQLAN